MKNIGNVKTVIGIKAGSCRFMVCLLSFLFLCTLSPLRAEVIDYSKMKEHPRLLMTHDDEQRVRNSIKDNREMKLVFNSIIEFSDQLIYEPTTYFKKTGKRLLDVSREALKRIFYTSFAYRITGEKKYLVRAEQELRAVCTFESWNPTHFLDVGEMTMAVAIGYDWLYNELHADTRDMARKAILEKGFAPSRDKKYNGFLTATSNWNQVCNTGMLYGAVALMETDKSECVEILERALNTVGRSMHGYAPDGNYPEGYNYWGYGTSFNVFMIAALESAFGTDAGLCSTEGFMESARYMLYMAGSTGLAFNFSDARETRQAFPAQFWFAARMNDSSLLWNEKQYLSVEHPVFSREEARFLPLSIIYGSKIDMDNLEQPQAKVWSGRGATPVTLIRTDWGYGKGRYVGIKGGKASNSHAHMDAGSFVFESDGIRWAQDLGMQEYETLESKKVDLWNRSQDGGRWTVYRYNNFVHNTLTVNDKLHRVDGFVSIDKVTDKKNRKGAELNMTPLFEGDLKKAVRQVMLIDDNYLQITDKVTAGKEDAKVSWTMTTDAVAKLIDSHTVELTKGGKQLKVVIDSPKEAAFQILENKSDKSYDAPNPGSHRLVFNVNLNPGRSQTLKVRLMPQ